MSGEVGVFGYGAVGAATVERLAAAGRAIVVAQRQAPSNLPPGVQFCRCDALDSDFVRAGVAGLSQVVLAIGFPYVGALWREAWPRTMTNFVEACAAEGARLVFFDNLYMFGPQTTPLSETTPLQPSASSRRRASRRRGSGWRRARPGGCASPLCARPTFTARARRLAVSATRPSARCARRPSVVHRLAGHAHDFAFVPDCARAVVSLLDASDDAYGQAWHVPCAPIRTPREFLAWRGGDWRRAARDQPADRAAWPSACSSRRCANSPRCDSSGTGPTGGFDSLRQALLADATPFEVGAPATALWFRDRRP